MPKSKKSIVQFAVLIIMTILAIVVAVDLLQSQTPADSLKLSVQDLQAEIERSENLIIMTQGRIDILRQMKALAIQQSKIKDLPKDSSKTVDKKVKDEKKK